MDQELTDGHEVSPQEARGVAVSVAVCTHNRADTLMRVALKSLLAQAVSDRCTFEVIVVDNASQDDTRQRVCELAEYTASPRIRYICEPNVGLSHARNRGIAEAEAGIIAFLDDDAEAAPGWIQALIDACTRHPDAWAVGGRTVPVYDGSRPDWFEGRMLGFVGGHDLGAEERRLPKTLYLQGTNMALRRQAFETLGRFRTELGRVGKKNLSHEEGELFWRLHKAQKPIYYVPSALVFHHQPPDRLRFRKLTETTFWGGLSESAVDMLHFGAVFLGLKSLRKLGLSVFAATLLLPAAAILGCHSDLFYWFLRVVFSFGYLRGAVLQLVLGRTLLPQTAMKTSS